MTDYKITPPPELVHEWDASWRKTKHAHENYSDYIATQAARWGADQELDACCEWLTDQCLHLDGSYLRTARRPKPPSPKEEALQVLETLIESRRIVDPEYQALRHALEQLND